ncbi:hypothetical protein M0M57_13305 [Flavobacterium azooxidireducens]|uniref:Lipoprotein n=1 Tax=Flavobacterium azooxidireducens TaxID=1871076 RepID=A0ABY4KCS9_9FLAO|nr:hypothetical protein [Flavobacterium azooxidireducens]UPQ78594.1 hypothetical protein M0M57_13305 [Flavobacterium azooxidireducens]
MKSIICSLVIVLFYSCQPTNIDSDIVEFEKELGEKNVATINLLLEDFEQNYLKVHYKNQSLDSAYYNFLVYIKKGNSLKEYPNHKKMYTVFSNSDLFSEIYLKPDSVWIARDKHSDIANLTKDDKVVMKLNCDKEYPKLIKRYKSFNQSGKVEYDFETENNCSGFNDYEKFSDEEIIMKALKQLQPNNLGKYTKALYNLQDRGTVFKKFQKIKESAGFIDHSNIAFGLVYYKADMSDYFIRRIILLEMIY